ncbi:MAG: ABC transporter permease [Acidobacteriota bacterium]
MIARHDLSLATRRHLARPGLTILLVLTLALGIGANVAIFSIVKAVLLESVPFRHGDRLAYLGEWSEEIPSMSVSWPNFVDWRERQRSFEAIAPHRYQTMNLTGDGRAEQLTTVWTSADLFPGVLRVDPQVGRFFDAAHDQPGRGAVAVVSHRFWQRRLGGSDAAIGRTLTLDGDPYEVVGVLPPGTVYPLWNDRVDVWLPIGHFTDLPFLGRRDNHPGMYVTARLAPGIDHAAAEADMRRVAAELAAEYPDANEGHSVSYAQLGARMTRDVKPALFVLSGAVLLVLVLACVNVANLLLARGARRAREMAVRSAIGAGAWQIVRQLLVESFVLALLSGVVGVAVAFGALRLLLGWIDPEALPVVGTPEIDLPVLGFALAVSLLTGVVFGLAPAAQALRRDVVDALREGAKGSEGGARQRVRSLLVAAQVALALVLLVGAFLFLRSFANLLDADLGIDPRGVLAADVVLSESEFADAEDRAAFYDALRGRVATLPGVESATLALPLFGGWQTSVVPEGWSEDDAMAADITRVAPDYAATMGLRLERGRMLDAGDTAEARQVVVIDSTFAETAWPGEDPLGKRVGWRRDEDPAVVVGVVNHVKNYGVAEESRIELYVPMAQAPHRYATVLLKTSLAQPEALVPQVEAELAALSSSVPLARPRTVERMVGQSLLADRLLAQLLGAFGAVALLLSALGLYGILAYHVAQRRREIGIRVALGAGARDLLRLVVGQGLVLTGAGLGAGLAVVWMVVPLVRSQLYGVPPRDPVVLGTVVILMLAVACLAAIVPLRRARRVDPAVVLRED